MNVGEKLHKWYEAKKKLEILERKINKYKLDITKQMNKENLNKITEGGYSVTRRKNVRSYVTKDSLPSNIWKEYATKCDYESYFLVKL